MGHLRRANSYRWDSPAFTRISNNPADSFVTGIPGSKVVRFDMGDPNEDWDVQVDLISTKNVQLRHNALEAARQTVNRCLERNLGKHGFYFKLRPYPHHIMRENKMATGAGADRVQTGMRSSYGKPVGKAARVKKGQIVASVYVKEDNVDVAKDALRRARMKFSCAMKTEVTQLKEAKASAQ